ncbi:hypothetical protein GBA63_19790 [Rubrobacter tropicus]|uniref:Uncharacterized protein n=1 Tax=Rubrobacter tropicus TaxID=2653851 RepID=A0A6G8QDW3_9ACTN|nr:hypothetical protein [Rubrobacter tropicus]QIN84643.1 hypothetical protein GBA63_19790 [Rubrobacter tropicus]
MLARVLDGEGWTTTFVDAEFGDPLEQAGGGAASLFPFLEVDPVDARLLPQIERDQIAIMGRRRAAAGDAAGEASLVHVARHSRPGSIVLSNDPHAVRLGRRHNVSVRGTLYVLHRAFSIGLLSSEEAWMQYRSLQDQERRPPRLIRAQLERYLETGTRPG